MCSSDLAEAGKARDAVLELPDIYDAVFDPGQNTLTVTFDAAGVQEAAIISAIWSSGQQAKKLPD